MEEAGRDGLSALRFSPASMEASVRFCCAAINWVNANSAFHFCE
jgi:hypothetical protein